MSWKSKLKEKTVAVASSEHARAWLFVLSFLEAAFLPIFIEAVLVPVVLTNKKHSWHHTALITTVASALGALFGYAIGYFFFGSIGAWLEANLHLAEQMETARKAFTEDSFVFVLTAAVTPIPFKVGAWTAGLFHMHLLLFTGAVVSGRALRIYSVSYLVHKFGKQIAQVALKYFNIVSLLIVLIIVVYFLLKINETYAII